MSTSGSPNMTQIDGAVVALHGRRSIPLLAFRVCDLGRLLFLGGRNDDGRNAKIDKRLLFGPREGRFNGLHHWGFGSTSYHRKGGISWS